MIFEDRTQSLISNYRAGSHQAVLLSGPEGIGLLTVADALRQAIGVDSHHVIKVEPEPDVRDISIDQIRQLYQITKSIRSDKLIILIDEAERMSLPAQNSLLKLIEEPPTGVKFILTTHHKQLLLPTVISRLVEMEIQPISDKSSQKLIESLSSDKSKNQQVMFIAKGLPAMISRLLSDKKYFESQVALVRDAKDIITVDDYQKIKIFARYLHKRDDALLLLGYVGKLLSYAAFKSEPDHQKLLSVSEAIDNIKANGNLRIHLLALVYEL